VPAVKINPPPMAFVYRDIAEGIWDASRILESRLPVYLEGGWHVLISDSEIRQQAIADEHARQTSPFNGLRERL
jgi:hypothetical protein